MGKELNKVLSNAMKAFDEDRLNDWVVENTLSAGQLLQFFLLREKMR